jgi:biotin transporter BioY
MKGEMKMAMRRMASSAVFTALLVFTSAAFAQEESVWRHVEVSVQGTGFFTKDSQENGISQHSTDTGGFLVGYRYHYSRWLAGSLVRRTTATHETRSKALLPAASSTFRPTYIKPRVYQSAILGTKSDVFHNREIHAAAVHESNSGLA